jgi:hypothetical protein
MLNYCYGVNDMVESDEKNPIENTPNENDASQTREGPKENVGTLGGPGTKPPIEPDD